MPAALDTSTNGCTLRLLTQRHICSNLLSCPVTYISEAVRAHHGDVGEGDRQDEG